MKGTVMLWDLEVLAHGHWAPPVMAVEPGRLGGHGSLEDTLGLRVWGLAWSWATAAGRTPGAELRSRSERGRSERRPVGPGTLRLGTPSAVKTPTGLVRPVLPQRLGTVEKPGQRLLISGRWGTQYCMSRLSDLRVSPVLDGTEETAHGTTGADSPRVA